MKHSDFVHLHNHTQYSLLDGACKINEILNLAKEYRLPALAITDHGNMFGAIEFYKKALNCGIKPIIGSEVYMAPKDRTKKEPERGLPDTGFHLILLAKNYEGYKNLISLSTIGYLEGFYHRPRIDKKVLKEYNLGLIGFSSCLKGEIPHLLLSGNFKKASEVALEYKEIFGEGNFYLEIQDHGLEDEQKAKQLLIKLSKDLKIPLICTNDCHYLRKLDYMAHDALLCIQTGKKMEDTERMRFSSDQLYFKPPEEMKELFREIPEAVENTLKVAEECNLELEFGKNYLPHFPLPEGFQNLDSYLERLVQEGFKERYNYESLELKERLERELKIIEQMGFASYFLIVKDFIDFARNNQIPVGPGRGSAAGSLVSYCLGITNIDPMRYGLLFERFLNPERISLPDIDIDFSDKGRDKIIRYVVGKYGEQNVTQIITFGTMAARAVVRDVGRVMGMPYSEVDRIAKMIPMEPDMTLERAMELEPELKKLSLEDQRVEKLISYSKTLEGLTRHASTHAAGVVIAPSRLTDFVPLYKSNNNEITTQYDMKGIEEIGLLKMDFLGLRTLSVIDDTLKLLWEEGKKKLDINSVPLDDEKVFELFSRGQTVGIFQFESSGMRDYLRKLKPESLEDLTAMNALYRPGPLDSYMIDEYIERKRGRKKITYEHPLLEPILKETYGVIVYQEQVLKIASDLAGYSLGKADILRKAMGKKQAEMMAEQRDEFISGAKSKKIEEKVAERVFDWIATFARYGFNKSHSVGYAYLAYQTAFLKAHFPVEFMAASLSSETGDTNRIVILMDECKRMGISLLPPDVNESSGDFKVTGKKIRFGLGAIKNVGSSVIQSIVQARVGGEKFKSIFDFCLKVEHRKLNKRAMESLIQSGAFDSTNKNRAQLMASVEMALSYGETHQKEKAKGQTSLFTQQSNSGEFRTEPKLTEVPKWHIGEVLSREKEVLGFYISGHPLSRFELELKTFADHTTESLEGVKDGSQIALGGLITNFKMNIDKKGKQMAFITLEDFLGTVEVIVFSDCFEKYKKFLKPDAMVLVYGRNSTKEQEKPKLIASQFYLLSKVYNELKPVLHLKVFDNDMKEGLALKLKELLSINPGESQVILHYLTEVEEIKLRTRNKVQLSRELMEKLIDIIGKENLYLNQSTR
ncbi:MAG: DNA polymerase III subunit alpha [candidate division Zixibacteria bacterium]|nr:DNA polymerase III subunit alpha [candidate division Zixibacteria bacterium]